MTGDETETDYLLRRAREEAYLALRSELPEVASAHHRLAIHYSSRVRSAFPQLGEPIPPARAR